MLLKIAVAVLDKDSEEKLINKLIGISMVLKVEFETLVYSDNFAKLISDLEYIDITVTDYAFLEKNKKKLSEFFVKNYKCMPIVIGTPAEKICNFLIIRPAEYIDSVSHIDPESNEDKVKQICCDTIEKINFEIKDKSDNRVIYITTRQESYAIARESIIYCQSDLKYTVLIMDNGTIIRKLSKLQEIEDNLLWNFVRVHQSFLINPKRITGIDKRENEIIMDGGFRIPYSKKYSKVVKDLFINGN